MPIPKSLPLAPVLLALAGPLQAAPSGGEANEAPLYAPHHGGGTIPADLVAPLKAPRPEVLPNRGRVLSLIETDSFAFIEVELADRKREWLAAPLSPMKVGDTIGFSDGDISQDFYSKKLQRNFPTLRFVDHAIVVSDPR